MLRVPLNLAYVKRTLRPLYAFDQATPKSQMLDPLWNRSVAIFPGMVAMKTGGEKVSLINGTGVPYGLFGEFIGGNGIDQILEQGVNACSVWALGPDAEFEVLAPAFDNTLTWTDPGNGTIALVYASTAGANRGKLVPAGATNASGRPVARLISVDSPTQITIGGLTGTQ